jgi:hypothetical protein
MPRKIDQKARPICPPQLAPVPRPLRVASVEPRSGADESAREVAPSWSSVTPQYPSASDDAE